MRARSASTGRSVGAAFRPLLPLPLVLLVLLAIPTDLSSQSAVRDETRSFFETHCAACHGAAGRGNGPMAMVLRPVPRDFGVGLFHVVSTNNRIPSDQDLLDTLRLGIAGTAMPSWSHLPDELQLDLVRFIREASVDGAADRREAGESPEEARLRAAQEVVPGELVNLGAAPVPTDELLAVGRALYLESCVECHAEDGSGSVGRTLLDDRGHPSPSRDFRRGLLRGGTDPLQLALRIRLGMPGTAMPSFELPEDDLWAVATYVASLVPDGSQERLLPTRRDLVAPRSASTLDALPTDWQHVPETFLPMLPWSWDSPVTDGLRVQVLHDGERLAVRVRWEAPEATRGTDDLPRLTLQLSSEPEPALFDARGAARSRAIWNWPVASAEAAVTSQGRVVDGVREVVLLGDPSEDGLTLAPDKETPDDGELRLMLQLRAGGARGFTVWHALHIGR